MKIWIHKTTGKIMLTWQCYAMWSEEREAIKLECPVYVGEACENENGVTVVFPSSIYNHFEFVGNL